MLPKIMNEQIENAFTGVRYPTHRKIAM